MTSTRGLALEASNLRLDYPGLSAPVVDISSLSIAAGERLAITGPSGSGKTSLAYVLAGIERAGQGTIRWDGVDIATLPETGRDRWRRRHVGFVFQDFHLVPGLDPLSNVLVACWFERLRAPAELVARAASLLERFGVPAGRRDVSTLSRGEQQRVAIARALLHRPALLVADEPTASLDAENGAQVADLLLEAAADQGSTLLAVTHDPALMARLPRLLKLVRGRLAEPAGGPRGPRLAAAGGGG
ncbi:MAG TPA: ABC transporter ATP-binding protein [Geminicoccaceae bacterium]|nr:ABC transporter ATP-binding protein [Geminicoccus sp.]HMU49818.1 ABC transporter ATP-binding protein [Geminicoccaceae bacterium]